MTVAVDLDGVIWLSDEPIPGGAEAVDLLRAAGERVVFLTNNSWSRAGEVLAKLGRMGIDCPSDDLVTSAQAAATLLHEGARAMVLGGPGIVEALEARGVEPVDAGDAGDVARDGGAGRWDAVVVGFDRRFDFERLARGTAAVLAGAQLIATNDDATFPTPEGPLPGGGSLVAAVAYASGTKALVAGKPNQPVVSLVNARVGDVRMMVGDRPSTDGAMARRLGAQYGLVLTGVTPPGHGPVDPAPDIEASNFLELAKQVIKPV